MEREKCISPGFLSSAFLSCFPPCLMSSSIFFQHADFPRPGTSLCCPLAQFPSGPCCKTPRPRCKQKGVTHHISTDQVLTQSSGEFWLVSAPGNRSHLQSAKEKKLHLTKNPSECSYSLPPAMVRLLQQPT